MNTVAIILARAGSRRIPGKNMANFCGKPLLLWTIEQLQEVEDVDSIWVSSDSKDILKIAAENNCHTILRPDNLSGSKASSESGWIHAMDIIEKKEGKIDIVIAPQVTSPVRESKDILSALREFKKGNCQFMLSCNPDGVENGSFYIFTGDFKETIRPRDTARKFYMESWKSGDINYPIDLKICEVYMKHFLLNDRYYDSRDSEFRNAHYKEGYYQNKIDPDGVARNIEKECEKKLEDCKEELTYINNLPPGRILDFGCGFGYMLFGVDNIWAKHGVELNSYAASYAKKYCKVFQGTLEQAHYESDFFDVIILYHVIEHLENPIESVVEIRRILKPNGKLIICTPDFKCGLAQRFGSNYRLLHDKTHVNLFGTLDLFRLLTDLEFRVEKVSYPYFDTSHFMKENLLRLFDTSKISPPFYGNIIAVYSHKESM